MAEKKKAKQKRHSNHPFTNAQTAQRAYAVVQGRVEAKSFRQIGEELGISHTAAMKLYKKAIELLIQETVEEAGHIRQLSYMRLEDAHKEAFKIATNAFYVDEETGALIGDNATRVKALGAIVRINESMRKLFGADAPFRHEHSGPDGQPIPMSVESEVTTLSDDALDKELKGYWQGVEDGRVAERDKQKRTVRKRSGATAKPKVKAEPEDNGQLSSGSTARGQSPH